MHTQIFHLLRKNNISVLLPLSAEGEKITKMNEPWDKPAYEQQLKTFFGKGGAKTGDAVSQSNSVWIIAFIKLLRSSWFAGSVCVCVCNSVKITRDMALN